MKYIIVCLSVIAEAMCLMVCDRTLKKSKKYGDFEKAETDEETNVDIVNSENDKCIEDSYINGKISRKEIIEIGIFILLAGIISYVVSGNVNSYIDLVKLIIGYIGLSIAASIDYRVKLIPNVIVLALMGSRILLVIFEYIFEREEWIYSIGSSLLSAVIVFVVLFILSVISKSGLGMGDVKLLTALAFLCGIYSVLNTMIVALIICVLVAMVLVLSKKKKMKDKIPFGPFLLIGYIITMCLGAY